MSDCMICGGARVIRLPVRQPLRTTSISSTFEQSAAGEVRTYPCPECAETVPLERVAIVETHCSADLHRAEEGEPGFMEHVHRRAASGLAEMLLRGGLISFKRRNRDDREMTFEERATVGVVSPRHVAALEERIAARQVEIAHRAAEIAIADMAAWGRDYGEKSIPKDIAARDVRAAVRKAIDERKSQAGS